MPDLKRPAGASGPPSCLKHAGEGMPDAVTVALIPWPRTAAASSVCALSSGGGSASTAGAGAAPRAGGNGAPTLSCSGAAVAATSFSLSCR